MGVGTAVGGGVEVGVGIGVEVAVACGVAVAVAVGMCVCVGDGAGTAERVGEGAGLWVAVGVKVEGGGVPALAHEILPKIVATIRATAIRAIKLLRQMYQCRAVTASLACFCFERASKRVPRQMFAHGISQDAFAPAVYDAHRVEAVPHCLVKEQL